MSYWSSDVCSSELIGFTRETVHGPPPALATGRNVTLTIDSETVTLPEGISIMRAASLTGTAIPKLCASDNLESFGRSEERRVGQECVSTCRSRWSPFH